MNIYAIVYYGSIYLCVGLSLLWLGFNVFQYGLYFFLSPKFISVIASIVEIIAALLLSRLVDYWNKTGKLIKHKDKTVPRS